MNKKNNINNEVIDVNVEVINDDNNKLIAKELVSMAFEFLYYCLNGDEYENK